MNYDQTSMYVALMIIGAVVAIAAILLHRTRHSAGVPPMKVEAPTTLINSADTTTAIAQIDAQILTFMEHRKQLVELQQSVNNKYEQLTKEGVLK